MANQTGLSFDFEVSFTDGTSKRIKTAPIDAMRWERRSKTSFLTENPTTEQLMFAAFSAATRQKLTDLNEFDKWAETVENLDPDPEDPEPVGPTPPAE